MTLKTEVYIPYRNKNDNITDIGRGRSVWSSAAQVLDGEDPCWLCSSWCGMCDVPHRRKAAQESSWEAVQSDNHLQNPHKCFGSDEIKASENVKNFRISSMQQFIYTFINFKTTNDVFFFCVSPQQQTEMTIFIYFVYYLPLLGFSSAVFAKRGAVKTCMLCL